MFKPHYFLGLATLVILPSCGLGDGDEDYDTSDPYGVPADGGYETAPYQDVNPPASNPTYGNAAYEETAPAASTPTAPAIAPTVASTHIVAKGDTLWGLSKQYNVTVDALRAANSMAADDNNVRLGQSINIPAP